MKQKALLHRIILASVFAAMTTVLTFYVKIPVQNGYLHIGDGIIYIAACLLPTPAAMLCGALGGCLADLLGGYTLYILPTFIIKGLLTLTFDSKSKKILTKRNILALAVGAVITVGGYYLADAVIISYSSAESFKSVLFSPVPWTSAISGLVSNLIQAAASSAVFIALATALDRIKIKSRITEE